MKKMISRVDNDVEENKIHLITPDVYNGFHDLIQREDDSFGVELYNMNTALVFWGGKTEKETSWEVAPQNLLYFEANVITRDLTTAEKNWCDYTFMYRGNKKPDELYEIHIPDLDKLKDAIINENIGEYPELQTTISDSETRKRIIDDFQQKLENIWYNYNQVRNGIHKGYIHDVEPRNDPDSREKTRSELKKELRGTRSHYIDSWKTVFNLSYITIKQIRHNTNNVKQPRKLDSADDIVALDVIGQEEKEICEYCGSVLPEGMLLTVDTRYNERKYNVCENCAKNYSNDFTDSSIVSALDERAIRTNGQRRLHTDFTNNTNS